jgi:hypothetical protein
MRVAGGAYLDSQASAKRDRSHRTYRMDKMRQADDASILLRLSLTGYTHGMIGHDLELHGQQGTGCIWPQTGQHGVNERVFHLLPGLRAEFVATTRSRDGMR